MSQFGFGWSDIGWLLLVGIAFPLVIILAGLPIVAIVDMVVTRL